MQMFEDIESICDIPLREKLERMEEYEAAATTKDIFTQTKGVLGYVKIYPVIIIIIINIMLCYL